MDVPNPALLHQGTQNVVERDSFEYTCDAMGSPIPLSGAEAKAMMGERRV